MTKTASFRAFNSPTVNRSGGPDDFEAALSRLRARLEEAKRARAAAEAKREMALKRKAEVEAQIREMGVDPERVEEEIARLRAEVREKLERAAELLRPFEELVGHAG